jgi:hypothetical protein
MALSEKLKSAREIATFLEEERQTYEDPDAKLMSEYLLPHRGYWPDEGQTKTTILKRGKRNVNPASTLSLERAAGGLTTGMTPEGQPWINLRVADDKLMESGGVRVHLDFRKQRIENVLRAGGFYQAIHLCNMELLGFPGMLLFADTSDKTLARFECCTFGTWAIALDEEGNLDTVVRRLRWSAKQLKKKYGYKKLSKAVQDLCDTKPYTKVDIIHLVRPREGREYGKIDNRNMKYESIMYEAVFNGEEYTMNPDMADVLNESGYHEMPYFYAPFARVGASDYGMSPGHLLIGHSRQLNETERQKLIALQKIVSPPMKKPGNFKGTLNVGPGAETAVSTQEKDGLRPLYEVPFQGYEYAMQEIESIMQRIAAVAKADLFTTMPDEMRPEGVTATEWLGKKREKLQMVAPVVSIYEPMVLDKVIECIHNRLERAGMFPEAPPALVEAGQIEIEYVSTIAMALRQVGAESTRSLMLDVKGLAEVEGMGGGPITVLRKINFPQVVDELARGIGAPASIIRDDEEFDKLIEQDRQAAQKQAEREDQQAQLEGAAKIGNISSQNTVLGEAMKQGA